MQDPTDLDRLGLTPTQPFYNLNLAGSLGVPSPQQLSQPTPPATFTNTPDYGLPDFSTPPLQDAELATPGLTYIAANLPDPLIPTLSPNELPYALSIIHQPSWPTTSVPDRPELTPATTMQDRPGDLDPSALSVLDASPLVQLIADKRYPAVQMDQQGDNTTMARHLTLLIQGLQQTKQEQEEAQ